MAKINLALSAVANVLALLNADNPGAVAPFTAANITLGVPAERVADADPSNTSLGLTSVADQGYTGTDTVTYTRLSVLQGNLAPVTAVPVVLADDQAAVEAKVIAALKVLASEVTFSAYTAPVDEATPGTITVTPVAGSLLYVGAAAVLDITVQDADAVLADNITQKQLSGFEPADA